MPIVENDPTFIANKEKHFISIAATIASASTHPLCPGGCIIVRDREIIGDGRSMIAACKVEVDCITQQLLNEAHPQQVGLCTLHVTHSLHLSFSCT